MPDFGSLSVILASTSCFACRCLQIGRPRR
jgi:hypothetical protein